MLWEKEKKNESRVSEIRTAKRGRADVVLNRVVGKGRAARFYENLVQVGRTSTLKNKCRIVNNNLVSKVNI